MQSKRSQPIILAWTLALALLANADVARAQLGPFINEQPPWTSPNNNAGIQTNVVGDSLLVDTNGDGFLDAGDLSYPTPAAIFGANDLRLSPTRQIVYATMAAGGNANVYFYRLPPVSGPLQLIRGPITVAGGVAHYGFFDQVDAWPQRIADVAEIATTGGQQVHWFDLETGAHSLTTFALSPTIGFIQFAPSGIEAFVQHGLNNPSGHPDYTLVSLCAGSLGREDNPGGLTELTAIPSASIVINAGMTQVQVSCSCFTNPILATITDCTSPPVTGACCLPGGGCIDGVTLAYATAIGGTWKGAGSTCATAGCPPPATAQLYVSVTGPATALPGSLVAFVLTCGNQGNLASTNTRLSDFLPTGSSFYSASNGGVYSAGTVTWPEGTLGPGASARETLTVQANCGQTSISNSSYSISGTPGGQVYGTPLTVSLQGSAAGVTLTVASVPGLTPPLHSGDAITQTIRLTNSASLQRDGLTTTIGFGSQSVFGQLIDAGGGAILTNSTYLTWTGSLGPSASTQLVFTTLITPCRRASVAREILNSGLAINLRDRCSNLVGTVTPRDTIPLALPPLAFQIWHTNAHIAGGAHGTTLVRPGESLDLDARVINSDSAPHGPVSLVITIPSGLHPVGNPPFIGTPPAGATWDSTLHTITWNGTVAVLQVAHIPFRVAIDSTACFKTISGTGSVGSCVNLLSETLAIYTVTQPPAAGYLLGLDDAQGVWVWDPATHGPRRYLLCMQAEFLNGLDVAPNGDIWVAGLPALRFNASTLDFRVFRDLNPQNSPPPMAPNASVLWDVKLDPPGSDVNWLASSSIASAPMIAFRWNPGTGSSTVLMGNGIPPSTNSSTHMTRDPDGGLAFNQGTSIVRIDPAHPGSYSTFSNAMIAQPATIGLDLDGNYLVPDWTSGTTTRRTLAHVDHTSGVFTELIHDLNTLVPSGYGFKSLAVASNADIYLGAPVSGLVAVVHRSRWPTLSGELLFSGGYGVGDLHWVGGATVGVPQPPRVAPMPAFALCEVEPNPAVGAARVRFSLPATGRVTLKIHDLQGREVATLANGTFESGEHFAPWKGMDDRGRSLPSGIYFVRLSWAGREQHRKLVLAR